MKVTNLPQSMHDIFGFHSVHGGLDGRVRRPFFGREGVLNFANGALILLPERLHDLELELRKFWRWHVISYRCSNKYHTCMFPSIPLQSALEISICPVAFQCVSCDD